MNIDIRFEITSTESSFSHTKKSDTTASPTETRCAAIAFFSKAALSTPPTSQNQIVQYFLQRNTVQDQANAFRVALAYEATLRWDDFADTLFGDFIVTHDFVRVFLVDTKTDNYKSGQWTTFLASSTETSAYTLLQNLVKNILSNASQQSLNNSANFPIMFKSLKGSENEHEIPKITHNEFKVKIFQGASSTHSRLSFLAPPKPGGATNICMFRFQAARGEKPRSSVWRHRAGRIFGQRDGPGAVGAGPPDCS
jgi:hypothetical protein